MKDIVRITILSIVLLFPLITMAQQDTDICPGRGERCAYVKILGVKIWQKKTKGGPGILIKEVKG